MKYTLYVKGMHCISCELLIQKSLEEIEGVQIKNISHKTGKIELVTKIKNDLPKIEKVIKLLGYTMLHDGKNEGNNQVMCEIGDKKKLWKDKKSIIQIILITLGWILIFLLLRKFNVIKLLPNIDDTASIGVALLMGLIASISTCLAVTGAIVLGFSQYADDAAGRRGHIKTQIVFQLGRIGGFFVLGGFLGLIGQVFKLSLTANSILTIIVGIVVLYMGLHLVGILPSITSLGFHLPKSWTKNILTTKNPLFAPVVGALTFFLPCGFTQSMQLVAMNAGGFVEGGLTMAMFALGTMPVLLAIGLGINVVKEKKLGFVYKVIGVLVVFFGAYSLSNGRGLLSSKNIANDSSVCDVGQSNCIIESVTGYQKIEISHDGRGLVPEVIKIKAGGDYEITILPTSNGKGCMNNLLVPGISNTVYDVVKGTPITYKVNNIQAGVYKVVCGNMGMYQGKIVVE